MKYVEVIATNVSSIPMFPTVKECKEYLKTNYFGHGNVLDENGNFIQGCKCLTRMHPEAQVRCSAKFVKTTAEAQEYLAKFQGHGTILTLWGDVLQTCRCRKRDNHPIVYSYELSEEECDILN